MNTMHLIYGLVFSIAIYALYRTKKLEKRTKKLEDQLTILQKKLPPENFSLRLEYVNRRFKQQIATILICIANIPVIEVLDIWNTAVAGFTPIIVKNITEEKAKKIKTLLEKYGSKATLLEN